MKPLPKLFKNQESTPLNHNIKLCHVKEVVEKDNQTEKTLDKIFHRMGRPYRGKVMIHTKEKDYQTYLIAKTKKTIITVENEEIPIEDILSIEEQ